MGKGDKKSRRGKIWRGTYGKYRLHKIQTSTKPASQEAKVDATKEA